MIPDDEPLRRRLVELIRRLPHDKLIRVAQFAAELERPEHAAIPSPTPARDWPHAPVHRLSEHGTYFVTAGTLHKRHFFQGSARLDLLEENLLKLAREHGWQLEAWAVFSNHYHFVGSSQPESVALNVFLNALHASTAAAVNRLDHDEGRKVWHNFWDTLLTFERSYLARLNYVHQNAVKHGLVPVANQYRWCSAAWLERTARPAQVKTIYSFKTDQVRVYDDFDVQAP